MAVRQAAEAVKRSAQDPLGIYPNDHLARPRPAWSWPGVSPPAGQLEELIARAAAQAGIREDLRVRAAALVLAESGAAHG